MIPEIRLTDTFSEWAGTPDDPMRHQIAGFAIAVKRAVWHGDRAMDFRKFLAEQLGCKVLEISVKEVYFENFHVKFLDKELAALFKLRFKIREGGDFDPKGPFFSIH